MHPKITIILTVHNWHNYLKNVLGSIKNQNFEYIEVIIIDDYSEYESVKWIKRLMIEDSRIRFFQNNENRGALYYIQRQMEL